MLTGVHEHSPARHSTVIATLGGLLMPAPRAAPDQRAAYMKDG